MALLTAVLLPSAAHAASVPKILTKPEITGTARVGSPLTAKATWSGNPAPTPSWRWQRCTRANACTFIDGATSATYTPVDADLGRFLRVRLRVTNGTGADEARSEPTAAVTEAIATPTPSPTPPPAPIPSPTDPVPPEPEPEPTAIPAVPEPEPAAQPVPEWLAEPTVVAPPAAEPSLLDPFPVVRIKGVFTPAGVRVTLLSVRAPRGARVTVTCRGQDCPARTFRAPTASGRLRLFERGLRAGTRLEIRITKPGFVGKSTRIVIRRAAAPRRIDRCLPPGKTRPVRCPVR